MTSILKSVRQFVVSEDGPTAVEYAVMLALILVACITIVTQPRHDRQRHVQQGQQHAEQLTPPPEPSRAAPARAQPGRLTAKAQDTLPPPLPPRRLAARPSPGRAARPWRDPAPPVTFRRGGVVSFVGSEERGQRERGQRKEAEERGQRKEDRRKRQKKEAEERGQRKTEGAGQTIRSRGLTSSPISSLWPSCFGLFPLASVLFHLHFSMLSSVMHGTHGQTGIT